MTKTVWLASYPKSGNTWFRMLIANLHRDSPVDINDVPESSGIASGRGRFDHMMLFPSGLLSHEECDALRPGVYQADARASLAPEGDDETETRIGQTRFIKTHDAYTYLPDGQPLMGGPGAADAAILIVRDPRDVVPSFANHSNTSLDDAITLMAKPDAAFCGKRDRQQNQMRQQLLTWGRFNTAWLDQRDIPVHLVRYEDLHADPAGQLVAAMAFAGVPVTPEQATRAAAFSAFEQLSGQERERGFREAPKTRSGQFFRRGMAGGWRDELTPEQQRRVEHDHRAAMARFGYQATSDRQTTSDRETTIS